MKTIQTLFCALVFAANVYAADQRWTVDAIQKQVLENSPELRYTTAQSTAEGARADQDALLPKPEFSVELGQLDSAGFAGLTQEWGLRQVLPFPTKIYARAKTAQARKHLLETELQNRRLRIQHQAVLQAVRLSGLQEINQHTLERQSRFDLIQQYLRSHPQASPNQRVDATLAQNQIRLLQKSLQVTEQEHSTLSLELMGAMGIQSPLLVEAQWITQPMIPELSQVTARLKSRDSSLQVLEARVQDGERRHQLAAQDWVPDLVLSGMYRLERAIPSNNQFIAGSLGISLPLWNRGQHAALALQTESDALQAQLAWERSRLEQKAQKLVANIKFAARTLERFPVSLAREYDRKLADAEQEFRRGRINGVTLLQMETQMHETLDTLFESQWKYLQAWSDLKLLYGESLAWPLASGDL